MSRSFHGADLFVDIPSFPLPAFSFWTSLRPTLVSEHGSIPPVCPSIPCFTNQVIFLKKRYAHILDVTSCSSGHSPSSAQRALCSAFEGNVCLHNPSAAPDVLKLCSSAGLATELRVTDERDTATWEKGALLFHQHVSGRTCDGCAEHVNLFL